MAYWYDSGGFKSRYSTGVFILYGLGDEISGKNQKCLNLHEYLSDIVNNNYSSTFRHLADITSKYCSTYQLDWKTIPPRVFSALYTMYRKPSGSLKASYNSDMSAPTDNEHGSFSPVTYLFGEGCF